MSDRPSGAVTLLFTDIEGSTRLLQLLGERYAGLLQEHQRLLRAAFDQWGGYEIDTAGDSFFVIFRDAAAAVAAAATAQRSLAAQRWPEEVAVRVRMGLHTGEVMLTGAGYVGMDLHRAARISAAGHGGQILLSQSTRDVVADRLPPDTTVGDLGAHRLKDLPHPEHLFQLLLAGLPQEFPPLKSLDAHPNNLPLALTRFIGREKEIAHLRELLAGERDEGDGATGRRGDGATGRGEDRWDGPFSPSPRRPVAPSPSAPAARLLTLTGAGGCGKTRLALELAAELLGEFSDGVWLVELAALTDAELVSQAAAQALGLHEEPGRTLGETLRDYLGPKELLLVLDNCEHLVEAAARMVEALLQSCPRLKILATSREALGLVGEVAWRVSSLSLPDEAVQLFVERAASVAPAVQLSAEHAPAVAQICRRLDGIPLAIELAAARVKVLSVEQIAARLDDRFRLLTGGSRAALPRQQTLRAAIDWSYDLLTEPERALLRRLSLFAGGWTLEAAEAVCAFGAGVRGRGLGVGKDIASPQSSPTPNPQPLTPNDVLDLLSRLVDKSLVTVEDRHGEPRYRLLETLRQYGRDRLLEEREVDAMRECHAAFFLDLAERAESKLRGAEQALWLERLETEHDNLRTALAWCREKDAGAGLRLGAALGRFWSLRGFLTEGRERLAELLALPISGVGGRGSGVGPTVFPRPPTPDPRPPKLAALRAKALTRAGVLAGAQGDYGAARALHEESLALHQSGNDREGIAYSLHNLALVAQSQGEYAAARTLYEESLSIKRELGDLSGIAYSLNNLGNMALMENDFPTARARYRESLPILRQLEDPHGIAASLDNLGILANFEGDYEEARALHEESLALKQSLGDRQGIALSLSNLASVAFRRGDRAAAQELYRQSLALAAELGDKEGIAECLEGLASVVASQSAPETAAGQNRAEASIEEAEQAAGFFSAAETIREAIGAPLAPAERAEHDRSVLALRETLGSASFDATWERGQTTPLEVMVQQALGTRAQP